MISKEAIESVMAIKEKLSDHEKKAECIADLENMIEIKDSHLYRADCSTCCGSICGLTYQIDSEMGMLQKVLDALRDNHDGEAVSLLGDYIVFLQKNYRSEHPNRW